jgi:plastocyanin
MGRIRRLILAAAAVVLTVSFAAGCSSDDGSGSGDSPSDIVPTTAAIGIADFVFVPSTVTVASGTTDITITNSDTADHTFTLDDGSVDQAISAGATVTVSVTVSEPAGFHCEIHPQMTGTLNVV